MADPAHLSIVIPAFNEEARLAATLEATLAYLEKQPYRREILVVDDGSTDGTPGIPDSFASDATRVRLVQHDDGRNHGKGAAVRLGMLAAEGRFRLFTDADNSTPIEQVEAFWPLFDRGADIVIGSRRAPGARVPVRQPLYKVWAGVLGSFYIRLVVLPGFRDTQVGFKMFTASCAEAVFRRMTVTGWGFDVEVLAIARHLGFKATEAPVCWTNSPESRVRTADYFEVLREVWRVRRNLATGLYD